jgi:hypothetical protein
VEKPTTQSQLWDISQLDSKEIYDLVLAQLKKDLRDSGFTYGFGEEDVHFNYPQLCEELCAIMGAEEQLSTARVGNLLYRVDVADHQLKKALQEQEEDKGIYHTMAELIIKRELQKVVLRKLYSANP